tara:strand:- start:60 stop:743 length:684 start_codon:yes stop_codon:yes gene_type:complete
LFVTHTPQEFYVADLFQEIDDELRQDKASKLWRIYGKYVITAAVIVIVLVAAYRFWEQTEQEDAEKASNAYEVALALGVNGDYAGAIKLLNDPIVSEAHGYAVLSKMQKANFAIKIKDFEAASITFKEIMRDTNSPKFIRQWAEFKYETVMLGPKTNALKNEEFGAFIATDNPWRFLAREAKASLELRDGNVIEARALFAGLADDENSPDRLRLRATEMLKALPKVD